MSKRVRIGGVLAIVALLGGYAAWLVAARHWFVTADDLHAAEDYSACLSAAPVWATAQGAIALFGVIAGLAAITVFLRAGSLRSRAGRLAFGASLLSAGAWLLLVFPLDPRDSLDIYAGCGLG